MQLPLSIPLGVAANHTLALSPLLSSIYAKTSVLYLIKFPNFPESPYVSLPSELLPNETFTNLPQLLRLFLTHRIRGRLLELAVAEENSAAITVRKAEFGVRRGHQGGAGALLQALEREAVFGFDVFESIQEGRWTGPRELGADITGVEGDGQHAMLFVGPFVQADAEKNCGRLACTYIHTWRGRAP